MHPLMRLTNEVSTYFPMLSVYVHPQHLQQTLIPTNRMLLPHCLKKDIVDVETKIYLVKSKSFLRGQSSKAKVMRYLIKILR